MLWLCSVTERLWKELMWRLALCTQIKVALKALSLLPAGGKVGARHLEQLSSGLPYLSGLWATKHSVPISCPGQSYVLLNTWKESKVQLSAALNNLDVCTETAGPSHSGNLEIHACFFLISISFIQILWRAEEKICFLLLKLLCSTSLKLKTD